MRDVLYWTWFNMIRRCYDNRVKCYKHYGGRGIKVCDRWRDSLQAFCDDMGDRPEGHVLDRIDNDGDYEPSNCKWSTCIEQQRNKRNTIIVSTVVGDRVITAPLIDFSLIFGIPYQTLYSRYKKGLKNDN